MCVPVHGHCFRGQKKTISFTRRLIKNALCSSSLSFFSEVIDQNYIIALILTWESIIVWNEERLFIFSVKSWLSFSIGESILIRRNVYPAEGGL